MALSAPRNTPIVNGPLDPHPTGQDSVLWLPVKGSSTIYSGALVVLNGGYAAPGTAATGLIPIGVAQFTVHNSGGADGDKAISVLQTIARWANSSAGDAIAQSDAGSICYIVDDQTVAKTDNSGARSPAGVVVRVDDSGVWVDSGIVSNAGDITGVTAGAGLSGGGSSGAVSLALDTTHANIWSGVQTFNAGKAKVNNAGNTFASTLASAATAARTATLPDVDCTLAQAAAETAATAPAFTGSAPSAALSQLLTNFTGTTAAKVTTVTGGGAVVAAHALAGGTISDGTTETRIIDNTALTATSGTITTVTGLAATITATGNAWAASTPAGTVASHTHTQT